MAEPKTDGTATGTEPVVDADRGDRSPRGEEGGSGSRNGAGGFWSPLEPGEVDSPAKAESYTWDRSELDDLSEERLLLLIEEMLLYRRFEEKAEEGYAIGKIGGFCHLHIGQEGVAAGGILPLRESDYVITAYRDHTQAIAKGVEPKRVMAELYGRADGASKGKGGSMHIFDPSCRFMGGHGIVGGHLPLAAGIGFAIRYREEDDICVCFMGDAAVNQGAFLESLNMVSVWRLPVIYVVENNHYGMGTAFHRVSATPIIERSRSFGIPAHSVNGQDVIATYSLMKDLAEKVRSGEGPQYVEMDTYRYKGHSMSDPAAGTYRSKEEVEEIRERRDPIALLRDRLFEAGILDQEKLEEIDGKVRAVVDEAAEFAEASPQPDLASLYEDVYAETNEHGRLFFDGRDRGDG